MYIPLARCIEVSINAVLICWKFGCLCVISKIIEFGLSKC